METRDLFFAAFLRLKGYEVSDFKMIDKRKAIYVFGISKEDYKKMKLEFMKSDISKIKQFQEELKDLIF